MLGSPVQRRIPLAESGSEVKLSTESSQREPAHAPLLPTRGRPIVILLGLYALLGGLVSLLGWVWNVPTFTDWDGDNISIQPNACVEVMAAGLALLSAWRWRFITAALGIFVGLIGVSTLFQYLSGINLDRVNTLLMFEHTWGRGGVLYPGRMGPPGALCWTLIGTALTLESVRPGARSQRIATALMLLTFGIATFSIVGYIYQADTLYSVPYLTVIALQTATFIAAVSFGVIAALPDQPPMRWFVDRGTTGTVARRVVPLILVLPIAVGWLGLRAETLGFYDARFGAAIFVLVLIVLLLAGLAWSLRTIHRQETVLQLRARQLDEQFAAVARLQTLSTQLVQAGDLNSLLQPILAAAADLTGTAKGDIQILDPRTGCLRIAVHQGLGLPLLEHFAEDGCGATCGAAAAKGERVIVEDVANEPGLAGTVDRDVILADGIRAIQSTPLISRTGRLLGILNTHFERVHRPPERDLRYLDLLARMAADVIERTEGENALREADRRKDAFLATLAHELRGPLAPMVNAVTLLQRADDDHATARKATAIMGRQLAQMVRLVDDLLDVSRISRDKLQLRRQRLELQKLLEHAVESCSTLAQSLGHQILVSVPKEPVYLSADGTRLVQVFANLINNACKYTPPGGRIAVDAELAGSEAVVRVQDSGIGIPEGDLASVFEIFNQLGRSLEQQHGGLGIGLYLVKRLVAMHDGTVEAHSAGAGRGTEFVVRLPVISAAVTGETPEARLAASLYPSRRFLVVEDNHDSAQTLEMLLKIHNHETHVAADGLEAVDAVERFRPDVVLLDIGLPKLNGYEACRRIREQAWGKDVLIVALTGWGQDEDRRKSRDAGFDHHMVKPVDYIALMALVASDTGAKA